MQCFKEDKEIDKQQLLEIAKTFVDFGRKELKEHRKKLREALHEYLNTLMNEKDNICQ